MIQKLTNKIGYDQIMIYYDQINIYGLEFFVCSTTETLSLEPECIYRMYACKRWTLKETLEAFSNNAKFLTELRGLNK